MEVELYFRNIYRQIYRQIFNAIVLENAQFIDCVFYINYLFLLLMVYNVGVLKRGIIFCAPRECRRQPGGAVRVRQTERGSGTEAAALRP